jgi:hypothetical protein
VARVPLKGKLIVADQRVYAVITPPVKVPKERYPISRDTLVRSKLGDFSGLDGAEVVITWDTVGPAITAVVLVTSPPEVSPKPSVAPPHPGSGGLALRESVTQPPVDPTSVPEPDPVRPQAAHRGDWFLNPYGFVPVAPRESATDRSGFGDGTGVGHHRVGPSTWSGSLKVHITAATPLLLLDTARAETASGGRPHRVYSVRENRDETTAMLATSFKGSVRSAFEAITDSRFGVWSGHDARTSIRMTADQGAGWLPARVSSGAGESLKITVVTRLGAGGPCVRVPAYGDSGGFPPIPPQFLSRHGALLYAWLARKNRRGSAWRVVELSETCVGSDPPARSPEGGNLPADLQWIRVLGRLIIAGPPTDGIEKHDERMFVEEVLDPRGLGGSHSKRTFHESEVDRERWRVVMNGYAGVQPSERRGTPSRHIGDLAGVGKERALAHGTLLFAREPDAGGEPWRLSPVMIGRQAFDASPAEVLEHSHPAIRPAADIDTLSPADRVFGWVGSDGPHGSYRGNVRVSRMRTTSKPDRAMFDTPLELAPLSAPRPGQYRFYSAKDAAGNPVDDGGPRRAADGYSGTSGLRGRKVYLHHADLPPSYWNPQDMGETRSTDDKVPDYRPEQVGGRYREYLAPPLASRQMNRGIRNWVPEGTSFETTLRFENLSRTELSALLWVLNLPADHHLKVGGGKPLGFGSVRVTVDEAASSLRSADYMRRRYLLKDSVAQSPPVIAELVTSFDRQLMARLPAVRAAVLNAAAGFTGAPVHYPRFRSRGTASAGPPPPSSETYEWFQMNDATKGTGVGGHALPATWGNPPTLPYDPTPALGRGGAAHGGRTGSTQKGRAERPHNTTERQVSSSGTAAGGRPAPPAGTPPAPAGKPPRATPRDLGRPRP